MANFTLTKSVETALKEEGNLLSSGNPSEAPMTIEGLSNKLIMLFLAVIGVGALSWMMPVEATAPLLLPAIFVGLGLSLWATFSKKVRVGAIVGYSAVQGFVLGTISKVFELQYPGIVQSAIISTLAMAAVLFFGLKFGYIKITDRMSRMFGFVALGYVVFLLINLGFSVFGGTSVYESQWGWAIALFGVGLASFSIANDFKLTAEALKMGLPQENEWRFGFGIVASLIWLYWEILRLFYIFNSND